GLSHHWVVAHWRLWIAGADRQRAGQRASRKDSRRRAPVAGRLSLVPLRQHLALRLSRRKIMPTDPFARLLVTTLAFSLLGILLFALAFWVIVKVSPFSVRKELEDDQNTAL